MYDNIILEINVIHSAWKNGCKKLPFLGSSCVYLRIAPQPMTENCLLTSELEKTNETYALAKISGLKYCEFFNWQYGTNLLLARGGSLLREFLYVDDFANLCVFLMDNYSGNGIFKTEDGSYESMLQRVYR